MKKLSEQELATLRATYAAVMVALQRGRVPVGRELQRLLMDSWDIVRKPADPAVAFSTKKASPLLLPFGEGME